MSPSIPAIRAILSSYGKVELTSKLGTVVKIEKNETGYLVSGKNITTYCHEFIESAIESAMKYTGVYITKMC